MVLRSATGLALLLGLLAWLHVVCAAPTGAPLDGEERARAIERLQTRQRDVMTLRATVVQRRRHPLLKDEVVTEGSLLFKRPNQVRWEVTRPERTIVLIDGHVLLIYRPARGEAERRDLRDDFGSRAAAEFLTAGMGLAVGELEKRFRVEVYRDEGRFTLWLTPKSAWVARVITSVAVTQEADDALPRQIVVVGAKGDRTETRLTNVALNPPLPADAFRLRLGPDVRVVEIGKPTGETGSGR